jgi:putative PIN family toxin of toxin-antitoxin system
MTVVGDRVVVDSNVLVASMISRRGENRAALRACLEGRVQPLIGEALFLEYEDVLGRPALFRRSPLSRSERRELFEAFLSVCEWVEVYFGWRPNLPDEGDNHVIELAVAGGAASIVTNNVSDFLRAELKFPQIHIVRPRDFVRSLL